MKTGLKVADAMTKSPVFVDKSSTVLSLSKKMRDLKVGNVIVIDNEEIVGIITERDIVCRVIAEEKDCKKLKAHHVMSKDAATITPDKDIYEAMKKLRDLSIRQLPVVDDSGLVGVLSIKDVLRIEPQLFELIAEKIEINQSSNIADDVGFEGICEQCGNYSTRLSVKEGSIVCEDCTTE